jgi:hypothetical protein
MNKLRFTSNVFAIAALTFAFAQIAQAQATRTWVSGVGDDANPCSRTAPCKTFAGAISKTAPAGEINALDPGGFGAVTITKAITIDGGGGQIAGVLVSGTNGIVVSAGSNDVVTLRNLDINGLNTGLNGVQILGAKSVQIDHCQIYGFTQNGINDNLNSNQGATARLFVNDCFIRSNSGGVAVAGSLTATDAFIDHCRIHGNSGFGVSASNGNLINVLHTEVTRNGGEGIKIDTGASAFVTGCVLNGNLTGALDNGAAFLLMDTTILNNGTGVSGAVTTFGNNNVRLNGGGNALPAPVSQQ